METMQELIEESIKDILSAEKQLVKALPKMAKAAQNPKLKESFETHLEETKEQVKRIEACMKELGIKPGGVFCKGMEGLITEASEHIEEIEPSPVGDSMLIGLAQKTEHYEICGYGTLFEQMKAAGMNDAVEMLKPNMAEEEKTDKLLSQLAESEINAAAAAYQPDEEAPKKKTASKSSSSSSNGKAKASSSASNGKAKSSSSSSKTPKGKVSVH